ncbi:MAG: NYN domain-containing protein [Patescibacteria group bacterium]
MIANSIKGRVYVFIDAANILYSQQTLGWRVDYEKLKNYFFTECQLGVVYFYTGRVGDNHKQIAFLKKLEKLGYIVKSKEVKRIKISENNYEWKGNLDVELTIGVLANLDNFDTLILMSGDSDFAPLLDEVKAHKKRVIVMSTKGHVSKELLDRAKYVNLKKLKRIISWEPKNPPAEAGRGMTDS